MSFVGGGFSNVAPPLAGIMGDAARIIEGRRKRARESNGPSTSTPESKAEAGQAWVGHPGNQTSQAPVVSRTGPGRNTVPGVMSTRKPPPPVRSETPREQPPAFKRMNRQRTSVDTRMAFESGQQFRGLQI